jgi:hypothetical protein
MDSMTDRRPDPAIMPRIKSSLRPYDAVVTGLLLADAVSGCRATYSAAAQRQH